MAKGTFRKTPGSLGKFKSTDALRRENKMAGDAARSENLTKDQARQLRDQISGKDLNYHQIIEIARQIRAGKL